MTAAFEMRMTAEAEVIRADGSTDSPETTEPQED